jgi:hypothetical protein
MKQPKIKLHSQQAIAEKLAAQPKASTNASQPVSSAKGFAVI